jgi:nitroimidazol reductase NimA-like FMN-containing flavoprotein (pyridoxamine 5'-phosphate oxidase superfamily)
MDIVKIPRMSRPEYDKLIAEEYICRIAFKGDRYPYITPFMYAFDGRFMYFLSTNYGKKIRYFREDPHVSVEVERYAPDLSHYCFVTLRGKLAVVEDPEEKQRVRESFVHLIRNKNISRNFLMALGHSTDEPLDSIIKEERTIIWKLVEVEEIVGLKDGKSR